VAGALAARGAARRVAVGIAAGFVIAGLVGLAVAAAALLLGQPYAVWYPPGLIGLIGIPVGLTSWWAIGRRFDELEQRRMSALDLG
jgi:hypothetical protein